MNMRQIINRNSGLTLIELMVTVAIVGILAGIGIPSYNYYTRTTKRSAAKTSVQQVRGLLEQYYTNNKQYTDNLVNLGFNNTPLYIDKNGNEVASTSSNVVYEITINTTKANDMTYCTTNCDYEVVATAKNTQATDDAQCGIFIFDSLGQKLSYNPSTTSYTTGCW